MKINPIQRHFLEGFVLTVVGAAALYINQQTTVSPEAFGGSALAALIGGLAMSVMAFVRERRRERNDDR